MINSTEVIFYMLVAFALGNFNMALFTYLGQEWGDIDECLEKLGKRLRRKNEDRENL